ncbi:hypothetical protein J3R82DRAFT_526 [Butyriboletus roseoflavus]|nr:hypothetical protein J3R82DRAFT_526 [Butyriboletus roseoflavus]
MIKFTSFGVPYINEFENVSFVRSFSSSSDSLSYTPSSSSSPPPPPRLPPLSLRLASSLFKRKPTHTHPTTEPLWSANSEHTKPLPPPPQPDASETHGIHIQFPPEQSHPQMSRKQRLVHLQQTISVAVRDAGMSTSSPGNLTHPEKHSNENVLHPTRGYKTPDAFFCGTYGQLMSALEGAGLSAMPCVGEGLSGYTRLGALFVARNDGASGVQLRKFTLWG